MTPQLGRVAIIGATGAVGREALSILESRGHRARDLVAIASARSAGMAIPYAGENLVVRALTEESFASVDIALLCASAGVSREHAPIALANHMLVVDNSSAFRAHPDVPLVVPEINPEAVTPETRLIANPNCTTIILLVALNPLRRTFGIERIVVSTYQAVSGAGAAAMDELREQSGATLNGEPLVPRVFREPCGFNVFSHNSAVDINTGVNGEEQKVIDEARKIWSDPTLSVTPTCVRVPVFRAHLESVTLTLSEPASEAEVRKALSNAPGLRVVDDRTANAFPTTLSATSQDDVLVGRIRPDPAANDRNGPRTRSWCLLVAGDQIRKGAALNAIQCADLLVARRAGGGDRVLMGSHRN